MYHCTDYIINVAFPDISNNNNNNNNVLKMKIFSFRIYQLSKWENEVYRATFSLAITRTLSGFDARREALNEHV